MIPIDSTNDQNTTLHLYISDQSRHKKQPLETVLFSLLY